MNEQKLRHYERLDRFISQRLQADLYPEPAAEPHLTITRQMIDKLHAIKPLHGLSVLDVGCGQGLALEVFQQHGANAVGVTMGTDYQVCRDKGFTVHEMDQSFLEFPAASFDVVWCRHAIEHSFFPLFTLHGLSEVLKKDGLLYVDVPAPTTSARHENNSNHYSCFTAAVWRSLFTKAGLHVLEHLDINFTVPCGPDQYHAFFLIKIA
jgi:SAM-dependent methyltransferase